MTPLCIACGGGLRWFDDAWYCDECDTEWAAGMFPEPDETPHLSTDDWYEYDRSPDH